MKQLYISDLDGTLLNEHAELSCEAACRLNRLIDRGLSFTVATARTHATVGLILKEVHLKLPLVLMNGVMLYDPTQKKSIEAEAIDPDSYRSIVDILKKTDVTGFVYTLRDGRMNTYYERLATPQMESFYEERIRKYKKEFTQTADLAGLTDAEEVIYISLLHTQEKLTPVYEALKEDERLHISFYRDIYAQGLWYLELSSANASKLHAVEKLRTYLNVEHITCFGDNLNDLPLFEAGDETCAVANAHEEVKRTADHVIGSNLENGVVAYLEEMGG